MVMQRFHDYKKLYYVISVEERNAGNNSWLAYEDRPAKHLCYDLRIETAAHGWRHIEWIGYFGCLIQIYYSDDHGNQWYFFKRPDSLVKVELPDDPKIDPNYSGYEEDEWPYDGGVQ